MKKDSNYFDYVRQLRKLRKFYGYTQQEIAEKLYMERSAYTYYETGRTQPRIDILIQLADLYDVSLDCLLGRERDWSDKELACRVLQFFNQYLQDGEKTIKVCTFFGHRDTPENIEPILSVNIQTLILANLANTFYVGNNGSFDCMVKSILREMQWKHPHITCCEVLAYPPGEKREPIEDLPTIYPDLENVPQRFAITYRNRWMVEKADYVIGYITHSWGGAAQFFHMAEQKGKHTINIFEELG